MNILKAILIGIVQGISDFLPVSRQGNIAFLETVLGIDLNYGIYFSILTKLGLLVAVVLVFHEDILHMFCEFFGMAVTGFANFLVFIKRKHGDTGYTYFKVVNSSYKKLSIMLIIASVPAILLDLLGRELVAFASANALLIGIGFIISAVVLFIADRHPEGQVNVKRSYYSSAVLMGIAQGVWALPGVSRTGMTRTTGFMWGYNRKKAIKYSFLLLVPTLIGSVIIDICHINGEAFGSSELPFMFISVVFTVVSGYFAMKHMLKLIRNKRYIGFAIYSVVMGTVAIVFSIIK